MPTTSSSLSPVSPYRLIVPVLALYRSTQFYLRFTIQHSVLSQLDLRLLQVSEWRVRHSDIQILTLSVVTHTLHSFLEILQVALTRNTSQLSQYILQHTSIPTHYYWLTHPTPISGLTFSLSCSRTLWLTQAQPNPPTHLCVCDCAITRLCHNTSLWILQLSALNTTTQRVRHHNQVMQTQVSSQYYSHSNHSTQPQYHNTTQLLVCFLLQYTLYSFLAILQVDLPTHSTSNSHSTYYNLLITQTHPVTRTHTIVHAPPTPYSLLGTNSTRP